MTISVNIFRSPVQRLLFICCPSAITLAVIPIVILPIQRLANRPVSHVFEKVLKRIFPPVAHNNSPASISVKVFTVRITAAVFHSIPRAIRPCIRAAVCFCAAIFILGFPLKASTTFGVSASHCIGLDGIFITARALTLAPSSAALSELRNDGQTTVSVTDNIFNCWHGQSMA